MKLNQVLEVYNTAERFDDEQDQLVPRARDQAYHGVHVADLLQKAGFKLDREATNAMSKEEHTIHAGTKVLRKGEETFYVSGKDQLVNDDGRLVHPLHHDHFMHIVDHMGLLKKQQHPHKAITWADFDMDAVKRAGIKTFVD